MTYEEAVKELYDSLFGSHLSNFHAELYFLIGKADPLNMARLRLAYPMEVLVWEEWKMSEDREAFFERYGFKVPV